MSGVWGEEDKELEEETFSDVFQLSGMGDKFSGEPDRISFPQISQEISKQVSIKHGWDADDYVWHISTSNPKLEFMGSDRAVLAICADTMSKVIPESIEVRMWTPLSDWDIREFTIKAMGLKSAWQIQDKDLAGLNVKLFEVLNSIV